MRKLEYKIDDLLVEKNEFGQEIINDLLIPSTAFVTFVTDDAKEDALHLADAFSKGQMNSELPASVSEDFKLIGNHFFNNKFVSDAPDPTDIIWENRHWTPTELFKRKFIAFSICIALLVASFFILLFTSKGQIRFAATFPPVDCSIVS